MVQSYSAGFRKLAWVTVGVTFLMMFWGNLVSSTGSGLACPDWPLCYGTITPPAQFDIILEWGHRVLGLITAICMISTCTLAFRSSKSRGGLLRRTALTMPVLLLVQILLGGITVLLHLSVAISSIHLIFATILFSAMITIACVVTWGDQGLMPEQGEAAAKFRRLAVAGLGALLFQFFLGAIVRHSHFALACPNFPACLDQFLPIPWAWSTVIAFLHRWWGVALLGLFVHLALLTWRKVPAWRGLATLVASLSVLQVFLGIWTVLGRLQVPTRAIHAGLGYLLWGLLFYMAIRAGAMTWTYQTKDRKDRPSKVKLAAGSPA